METSLPLRQVADDVCVAPQLTPEAMAELARLGFRSVVNNRPDFEHGPDQPTRASRTVFVFDFYKVDVFGRDTKVAIPLFLNDLGDLDQHQLRVLGLGAGTMIPYEKFHIRQFDKSRAYPLMKTMLAASFNVRHMREWLGRLKRRLRGAASIE